MFAYYLKLKNIFDRKEKYKLECNELQKTVDMFEKRSAIYSHKTHAYELAQESFTKINVTNAYCYSRFLDSMNLEMVKDSKFSIFPINEQISRLKSIKIFNYLYKDYILPNYDISCFNFGLKILSGISLEILDLTLSRFGIFKLSDLEFRRIRNELRRDKLVPLLVNLKFADMEGIEGIDNFEAKLGALLENTQKNLDSDIKVLDDQEKALEKK